MVAPQLFLSIVYNSQPGGHWTKAYPFIRLHQASCSYGVNSLPLSNIRDGYGNELFSVHDLATGKEVVEYYAAVVDQFRACGRVQLYFNCEYSKDESGNHIVTNIHTEEVTKVYCKKIVRVHSNLVVPSMRNKAPFPIDSNVNFVPINDLPIRVASKQYKKYVIIGAGKTASDAITYLLRNGGVDQSAITWIISRDVWFVIRDGLWESYETYRRDTVNLVNPLVECNTLHEAFLQFEKNGAVGRIDTTILPEVFKGPIIDKSELAGLRGIQDIVRLGRVIGITSNEIMLERGRVPLSSPSGTTLFVDCMADIDGTYYGSKFSEDFKIFDGNQINLGPIIVYSNVCCSSAVIAYIESTFEDDEEMRNNLLYFARGDKYSTNIMRFFSQFYYQNKTFKALRAYPPAMKFVLNSRTLLDAPCHHRFGMLGFLWTMFGPAQMSKKVRTFVERIESGYYSDCQDCFGCAGRTLPQPHELKIKEESMVESNYPPPK